MDVDRLTSAYLADAHAAGQEPERSPAMPASTRKLVTQLIHEAESPSARGRRAIHHLGEDLLDEQYIDNQRTMPARREVRSSSERVLRSLRVGP
jgi:hypothetical protein